MALEQEFLRGTPLFHLIDPGKLNTLDDFAERLDALLTGPCKVEEIDGVLVLMEIRKRVDEIDRGIRIEVWPDDHSPPHFHASCPWFTAKFTVEDCVLVGNPRGKMRPGDLNVVRKWHEDAHELLIRVWKETRAGECAVGVSVCGKSLPPVIAQ
jgi:hypothetical protein